jgi:hypothetical protein
MVLESYFQTPANKPKLTNTDEVQEAIRDLKVIGKTPGPNGIQYRALKDIPKWAVSLLVHIFNAILRTPHFSPVWKHA